MMTNMLVLHLLDLGLELKIVNVLIKFTLSYNLCDISMSYLYLLGVERSV